MRTGFTLLELIVVIIIIGVLATLGFTQYTKVVEKGRTAEARTILGQLRTGQVARFQEYGTYTASIGDLPVSAPTTCAGMTTHYFSYSCAAGGVCSAVRCAAGGKIPSAGAGNAYTITLDPAGSWGGTAGYY